MTVICTRVILECSYHMEYCHIFHTESIHYHFKINISDNLESYMTLICHYIILYLYDCIIEHIKKCNIFHGFFLLKPAGASHGSPGIDGDRRSPAQEHPLADVFGAEGNPEAMASLGPWNAWKTKWRLRTWVFKQHRCKPHVWPHWIPHISWHAQIHA